MEYSQGPGDDQHLVPPPKGGPHVMCVCSGQTFSSLGKLNTFLNTLCTDNKRSVSLINSLPPWGFERKILTRGYKDSGQLYWGSMLPWAGTQTRDNFLWLRLVSSPFYDPCQSTWCDDDDNNAGKGDYKHKYGAGMHIYVSTFWWWLFWYCLMLCNKSWYWDECEAVCRCLSLSWSCRGSRVIELKDP